MDVLPSLLEDQGTVVTHEEPNGVCASHKQNGSAERSHFLGEVVQPYQDESDVELNLSVGDHVIVPKTEKIQEFEVQAKTHPKLDRFWNRFLPF
ncbi:hypothetical protein BT93_L4028 [Corymbia citriodora subsp. variegata]|uniref:Uncharacterized protein n=1 Tax=Corymbia citriodora subsp. variegata TaxID=360336 RepID=A0A8T0CGC0_CORYI|nr:hypothetical protein BT93_L4028 [Corymbia citriodora subsp. variegata]